MTQIVANVWLCANRRARRRNHEVRFAKLRRLPRHRHRLPMDSAIRRSLSGAKGLRP